MSFGKERKTGDAMNRISAQHHGFANTRASSLFPDGGEGGQVEELECEYWEVGEKDTR